MHSNNCDKSLHNPHTQGTGGTGAAAILCACIALGLLAPPPARRPRPKGAAETGASTPTKKKGSIKVKHQRSPIRKAPPSATGACTGNARVAECGGVSGYTRR